MKLEVYLSHLCHKDYDLEAVSISIRLQHKVAGLSELGGGSRCSILESDDETYESEIIYLWRFFLSSQC